MGLVINRSDLQGLVRVVYGTFTFTDSYLAGGELADPGLSMIHTVQIDQGVGGRKFEYDYATRKIKAYQYPGTAGVATEVVDTTDLSTTPVRIKFEGQ